MHSLIRFIPIAATLVTAMPAPAQNNAPVDVSTFAQPVKLACVGDSITAGVGSKRPWPALLGEMLGNKWQVRNFGVSGATLMNRGYRLYQKLGNYHSRSQTNHQ